MSMRKLSEILQKMPSTVQNDWSNWLIFETLRPIMLNALQTIGLMEYHEKVESVSQISQLREAIAETLGDLVIKGNLDNNILSIGSHLSNVLCHVINRSFNAIIIENVSRIIPNSESDILAQWYEKLEEIAVKHEVDLDSFQ